MGILVTSELNTPCNWRRQTILFHPTPMPCHVIWAKGGGVNSKNKKVGYHYCNFMSIQICNPICLMLLYSVTKKTHLFLLVLFTSMLIIIFWVLNYLNKVCLLFFPSTGFYMYLPPQLQHPAGMLTLKIIIFLFFSLEKDTGTT